MASHIALAPPDSLRLQANMPPACWHPPGRGLLNASLSEGGGTLKA